MTAVKIPVKVQKRSGFDWSHHNALSQKVGQIVPIFINEVIPNSKIYLRFAMAGSMPPLASDAYMKCYYDIRAFAVPMRLLYGGFESWFADYPYNVVAYSGGNVIQQVKSNLPVVDIDYSDALAVTRTIYTGSLLDYLGFKSPVSPGSLDQNIRFSAMPLLAYHKLCDDWFRQPNISVSAFARPADTDIKATSAYFCAMAPFVHMKQGAEVIPVVSSGTGLSNNTFFADGVSLFDLRSANYDYDYFTNALPSKQLGTAYSVATTGNNFSIEALRNANSLQQFAELNQLCGSNLVSVVKGRYGANLHDSIAQRSIYLGGCRIDIANRAVDVKNSTSAGYSVNPFINQPGSSGGKVICQGTDVIIDNFVANEPMYIIVVGVVIPKVTYGTGIRRYLRHYIGNGSIVDMPNPMLQNIGNQPIYRYELNGCLGISGDENQVFGYTDRYAEAMTMEDECHALMSIYNSLGSFVAQRSFDEFDSPVIGTNFLQIPDSALNNITAVSGQISQYGFYGQFAFDCKVAMPLAQYSMPSLQNPAYEHGKTITLHRGGFRF